MSKFSALFAACVAVLSFELYLDYVKIEELTGDLRQLRERPSVVERVEKTKAVERIERTEIVDRSELSKETFFHILNSTVRLSGPTGQGTGVVIYSEQRKDVPGDKNYYTYIITCHHVLHGAKVLKVEQFEYSDGRVISNINTYDNCQVINSDEKLDTAIIEVKSPRKFNAVATFVTNEEISTSTLNDRVFVCGCPLASEPIVTDGNISSFKMPQSGNFQITAPIMYGNSGGGVFTQSGKILGIAKAVRVFNGVPYPHAGMATPAPSIRDWLQSIRLGFIINLEDGTSIDTLIMERDLAAKEEAKKAVDDFLQDLLRRVEEQKAPK